MIALTLPVFSSIMIVDPGSPSAPARGTDTILHDVVPVTRAGMKSIVWSGEESWWRSGSWSFLTPGTGVSHEHHERSSTSEASGAERVG